MIYNPLRGRDHVQNEYVHETTCIGLITHTHGLFRHLFLYSGLFPDLQCCWLRRSLCHALALGKTIFNSNTPFHSWMLATYILTDTYSTTYTHILPSQLGNHRYILLVCSFLRLILIPLFLLCNVQVTGKPRAIPVVFNNDAYPVVFNTILGLTNGYFISLAMIFGPKWV